MPPTEKTESTKRKRSKSQSYCSWTLIEKKELITCLKTYGFDDKAKLAEAIKTKSENEIEYFLKKRRSKMVEQTKRDLSMEYKLTFGKRTALTFPDFAHVLAPIEFWSYVTPAFINRKHRSSDYSFIFKEIFAAAAENEQTGECEPNLKQIYQYLSSLLGGLIGPQLSPINSMLVLHLIQELTLIIKSQGGFPDEVNYMQSLTGKAEYVCVRPKEGNVGCTSSNEQPPSIPSAEDKAPNQVIVSRRLQDKLLMHKKVQENLNPFSIPKSLMQKEQEIIRRYYTKS